MFKIYRYTYTKIIIKMEYQTLKEILKNSKDIAYQCKLYFGTHAQYARHLVYGEITTLESILEL